MSRKRSVASSAIGRRGRAAAAAYAGTEKNRGDLWEETKQKSAAYRWHRNAVSSVSCRLPLRSVEAAVQTDTTAECNSRKIDRGVTIRKSERRKSKRLLRRRNSG